MDMLLVVVLFGGCGEGHPVVFGSLVERSKLDAGFRV